MIRFKQFIREEVKRQLNEVQPDKEDELESGYEVNVKLDDRIAEMTYYQWLDNQ